MPEPKRRGPQVVSVIFEVTTESTRPRFNIPAGVTRLLGLRPKREIDLVIRDAQLGSPLYAGTQKLKSGTEIYGVDDVSAYLQINQRLRIEASRPAR